MLPTLLRGDLSLKDGQLKNLMEGCIMDYEELQAEIFTRFWRCNVLNKESCEAHAAIAVDTMKKMMTDSECMKPVGVSTGNGSCI